MSLVGSLLLALLIPLIIWGSFRQPSVKPLDSKYILQPRPQPKVVRKRTKIKVKQEGLNNMQKLAKNTLVTMGYSATEAKKMLEDINASSPEQYVQEAMKRVKI